MKEYQNIIEFIKQILSGLKDSLDKESIEAVEHYLKYNEIEMAFEGLFLEIINLGIPITLDSEICLHYAEVLKLNQESVFDFHFYEKLKSFLQLNNLQ